MNELGFSSTASGLLLPSLREAAVVLGLLVAYDAIMVRVVLSVVLMTEALFGPQACCCALSRLAAAWLRSQPANQDKKEETPKTCCSCSPKIDDTAPKPTKSPQSPCPCRNHTDHANQQIPAVPS